MSDVSVQNGAHNPKRKYVDLTHDLHEGCPVFPGGEPFRLSKLADLEKGYYLNKISMGEHTSTHVDAPAHFARKGNNIAQIPLDSLIGPVIVIDVSQHVLKNSDYVLSLQDVRIFEQKHAIPPSCFVCLKTGWSANWSNPPKYINLDDKGVPHFPGFTPEVARYLIDEKNILGLGIDTLSVDPGTSKEFDVHKIVLNAGKLNIENLNNLENLPPSGATIIVAPIKIRNGSGAPARVFAEISSSNHR